jgi:putative endonuclease
MVTLYVLRSKVSAKRYVGITNNLKRRLTEHRRSLTKGGQILGEFVLVHTESFENHGLARAREKFLKSGIGREWLDAQYPRPATAGKASPSAERARAP